jgi:Na+-transporting methylmalonyl-CoA/oxaloacetate decarboxylase gamma subunit
MVLSILAVAMAGVAWFATRHTAPSERLVAPTSQQSPSTRHTAPAKPKSTQHHRKAQSRPPALDRSKMLVEVFNNSHVTGLAGTVATRAAQAGWQVVGSDNWYGTIPASTVYYPPRLTKAGHLLALDLGIRRTLPAVAPMRLDRLTVILTGPLAPAR